MLHTIILSLVSCAMLRRLAFMAPLTMLPACAQSYMAQPSAANASWQELHSAYSGNYSSEKFGYIGW